MDQDQQHSDSQWNFHEEDLDLDDGDIADYATMSKMEQELRSYIVYLTDPLTTVKTNDIFETQYNKPGVALQLCQYYYERPHLKSYTINTELPRMNYTVILDNDTILTSRDEIEEWFSQFLSPLLANDSVKRDDYLVHDMLIRCSNQSLLADIFEALTTDDEKSKCKVPLIRNRLSASLVATKCRFVIDLRNPELEGPGFKRSVHVDCTFLIAIPSQKNLKLELAALRFLIDFSPEPQAPSISYTVVSINSLLNLQHQTDCDKLHLAAVHLEKDFNARKISSEPCYDHESDSTINTNAIIRDNFLNSITSTHRGISSALREIDHATNVSRKFNYLKSIAVSLPGLAAAAATQNTHEDIHTNLSCTAHGINHRSRVKDTEDMEELSKVNDSLLTSISFKPKQENSLSKPKPENYSKMSIHQHLVDEQSRPPPVLGSLIMTGLKNLAKAATLPDSSSQTQHKAEREKLREYSLEKEPCNSPHIEVKGNENGDGGTIDLTHDEKTELNDGWQDDDLFFEDEESVTEITDLARKDQYAIDENQSGVIFFSKARENMNNLDTKIFWAQALRRIADEEPTDCNICEARNDDIPAKRNRKRYTTRAERLGLNTAS